MKCKHRYSCFDHPRYGFMNVRLHTWSPDHIQIALNGREWSQGNLEKAGAGFIARENEFVHIDEYGRVNQTGHGCRRAKLLAVLCRSPGLRPQTTRGLDDKARGRTVRQGDRVDLVEPCARGVVMAGSAHDHRAPTAAPTLA